MSDSLASIVEIADIHEKRIRQALKHLESIFPIQESRLQNLTEEQFLYLELFLNRFAKLQDHIGKNLFNAYFKTQSEDVTNLTMLDKLHKLEKFGIVDDSSIWQEMRNARNIVSHEYPDNPKLVANTLNLIHGYAQQLLIIKSRLIQGL